MADKYARKYCKRDGVCQAAGLYGVECGPRKPGFPLLEWCHIETSSTKRLRHNPLNCVCMCGQHHVWFTNHNLTFKQFIEDLYPGRWDELAHLERTLPKADYDYWIEWYKEQGVKL